MIHFEHYKSGDIFGIRYRFEARGDGIPKHAHPAELAHNLVVIRGLVLLITEQGRSVCAPGIHDFDSSAPHEIVAMADDCETLHLFLNGQPADYADLPQSELRGIYG